MIVELAAISIVRHRVEPTLSIDTIVTPRCERLHSTAIPCTFASGTAAGDLATETIGLGFTFGAPCVAGVTATVFATWRFGVNAVPSFRIVSMLTRAFVAPVGDLLSQARNDAVPGFAAAWTIPPFPTAIVLPVANRLSVDITLVRANEAQSCGWAHPGADPCAGRLARRSPAVGPIWQHNKRGAMNAAPERQPPIVPRSILRDRMIDVVVRSTPSSVPIWSSRSLSRSGESARSHAT